MGDVLDSKVFTKPTEGASWQLQTKGSRQDVLTWLEYNVRNKGDYKAACVFPTTKKSTNQESPERLLRILESARDQIVVGDNWHSVLRTGLDHTSGATIEIDAEEFTPKQKEMIRDTYTKWWFATKTASGAIWMTENLFGGLLKLALVVLKSLVGPVAVSTAFSLFALSKAVPAEWNEQLRGLVYELYALRENPDFIAAGKTVISGTRALLPKSTLAGSDFTNSIPVSTADDTDEQETRIQTALFNKKNTSAKAYFRESQTSTLDLFGIMPEFVDSNLFGYFVCALLVEDFMVQHNINNHTIRGPGDLTNYRVDFGETTDEFLVNFASFVKQKAPALCANMTEPELSASDIFTSEFKPVVYLLFNDSTAKTGTVFEMNEPKNVKAWDENANGFKRFTVFSEDVSSDAQHESDAENKSDDGSDSDSYSSSDGSTSASDADDDEGGPRSTPSPIPDEATQQPPKEPTVGIKIQWSRQKVVVDAFVRIKSGANQEAGGKGKKAKAGAAASPSPAKAAGGKGKKSKISAEQTTRINELLTETQTLEVKTRGGDDTIMNVTDYFKDTFQLEAAVEEEADCDELMGLLDAFGPWALRLRQQMNNMIADGIPQKAFVAHNVNIRGVENLVKSTRAEIERKRKSIRDTRIVNLRKTIAALGGDKVDLDNAVRNLEAESRNMRKVVKAKQGRIENVENQLGKVTEQLTSLESELEENKKKVSEKESERKQATKLNTKLSNNITTLRAAKTKVETTAAELKTELAATKSDLKESTKTLAQKQKSIVTLEKRNKKLAETVSVRETANEELQTANNELKETAKTDTRAIARLEKRITGLETKLSSAAKNAKNAKEALATAEEEFSYTLSETKKNAKETLKKVTAEKKQVEADLKRANSALTSRGRSSATEKQRLEKRVQLLEAKLAVETNKVASANAAVQTAQEKFNEKIAEVKAEVDSAKGDAKTATTDKKRLQKELDKAVGRLERKEKRVAAATQATESKGFILHIRSGSSPTNILVYVPSFREANKKLQLSTVIYRVEQYGFTKIPGASVGMVPSESLVLVERRYNQRPMLLNTFSGQLLNSDNWGDDQMLAKLVPRPSRFDEAASNIGKFFALPLRKITDSAIRSYAEYAYTPEARAFEYQREAFIANTGATIGVVATGILAAGVYVASGVSYRRRTTQIAGDIRLACRNAGVA